MAVDYISEIKPLEDESFTDTQIIEHLSARTVGPINCGDAKVLLEEAGLVIENPVDTSQKSGSLITTYQGMADGPAKSNIGWFISHVFGRGQEVSSHSHPRAVQIAGALVSLPPEMQPVGDALLALGGGKLHPTPVVQADLDASRAAYAEQQAAATRRAAGLAEVQRLVAGSGLSNDAARAAHQAADYSDAVTDHVAAIKAAYDAAFDPNL